MFEKRLEDPATNERERKRAKAEIQYIEHKLKERPKKDAIVQEMTVLEEKEQILKQRKRSIPKDNEDERYEIEQELKRVGKDLQDVRERLAFYKYLLPKRRRDKGETIPAEIQEHWEANYGYMRNYKDRNGTLPVDKRNWNLEFGTRRKMTEDEKPPKQLWDNALTKKRGNPNINKLQIAKSK